MSDNDLRAGIEALTLQWERDAAGYPRTEPGLYAAAAVRLCARELDALLAAHPVQDEGMPALHDTREAGEKNAISPVQVTTADTIRPALSTWLTLALDISSEGPTVSDLLALRDWIDAGGDGEPPVPSEQETAATDRPEVTP